MALVVAQEVPASSTMAVPHGPAGVGAARRRMRAELRACGAPEDVVDDATLILSELLSNSCRHARPLGPEAGAAEDVVRASWRRDVTGELTISVTDGGGPTRPLPATPSVSARGGRGLAIITSLASDWGVEETGGSGGMPVAARARGSRFRGSAGGTGGAASSRHGQGSGGRATANRPSGGGRPAAHGGPPAGNGAVVTDPPAGPPGVTVWAVLAPGGGFGGGFPSFDLAELDESA